jgi:hypothetical protein
MGRQLRRVEKAFKWPVGKIWEGFENPHWKRSRACPHCQAGSSKEAKNLQDLWYGYGGFDPSDKGSAPWMPTEPAIYERALRNEKGPGWAADQEARRLCEHFNASWSHHLAQDEVDALVQDGRLWDFTRDFIPGQGWVDKKDAPAPLAIDVNRWSLSGMAHDSINCWIVIKHVCQKNGWPTACAKCEGEGRLWESPQAQDDYNAWEPSEPPVGPWWQMWETVSEGSPISPAFEQPEELARWLAQNRGGSIDEGVSAEKWMDFIMGPGWAPSMMGNSSGLVSGVEAMAHAAQTKDVF